MKPKRPEWKRTFFGPRRLTSKLKHLILERYVNEFARHLGSVRPTVYYVDGFAGAGVYRDDAAGTTEDGSPVLIAKLSQRLREGGAKFELRCINVEEDAEAFADLAATIAPFIPDIVVKNYHDSFADVLRGVLGLAGASPTFLFIDPFGTKGIPFASLRPIFLRSGTTEMFVNLQTDGIATKAGWFDRLEDPNPTEAARARSLIANLAAALDLKAEVLRGWWDECVRGGQGGTGAFERRVLNHYMDILTTGERRFTFVRAFPVHDFRKDAPPGQHTAESFWLVFATRKLEGLFRMNDAMADALRAFYRDVYRDTFFPAFESTLKAQDIENLKQAILGVFARVPFTITDAKTTLMQRDCPFVLRGGDYRRALLELLKAGRIERLDKGGPLTNDKTRLVVKSS